MNKISLKQGEVKGLTLTITDDKGAAVDLSAATLTLTAKKTKADALPVFTHPDGDFGKAQAVQGIVTVSLSATDTQQDPGFYVAELKCAWGGALIEKTKDFGIEIIQAVS